MSASKGFKFADSLEGTPTRINSARPVIPPTLFSETPKNPTFTEPTNYYFGAKGKSSNVDWQQVKQGDRITIQGSVQTPYKRLAPSSIDRAYTAKASMAMDETVLPVTRLPTGYDTNRANLDFTHATIELDLLNRERLRLLQINKKR